MSKNDSEGLYTDPNSFNPQVNAIPLSDVDTHPKGKAGITPGDGCVFPVL